MNNPVNNTNNANAAHAMDPHPSTLKPTDTIGHAADIIMQSRYRNLPVVDENFCYLGMFGVNCLLKQVIPEAVFLSQALSNISFIHESFADLYQRFDSVKDNPVATCMHQEIEPVAPDTSLSEVILQLYLTRSSIPVVEPGSCKLLGMISYWDIGSKILAAGEHVERPLNDA
ncbi:MAG: CBS domain-containing protein [Gammaproteobacteria bacterium]|nr:CBS domain-containing protein [Gammaproteobacteria bacterium]